MSYQNNSVIGNFMIFVCTCQDIKVISKYNKFLYKAEMFKIQLNFFFYFILNLKKIEMVKKFWRKSENH